MQSIKNFITNNKVFSVLALLFILYATAFNSHFNNLANSALTLVSGGNTAEYTIYPKKSFSGYYMDYSANNICEYNTYRNIRSELTTIIQSLRYDVATDIEAWKSMRCDLGNKDTLTCQTRTQSIANKLYTFAGYVQTYYRIAMERSDFCGSRNNYPQVRGNIDWSYMILESVNKNNQSQYFNKYDILTSIFYEIRLKTVYAGRGQYSPSYKIYSTKDSIEDVRNIIYSSRSKAIPTNSYSKYTFQNINYITLLGQNPNYTNNGLFFNVMTPKEYNEAKTKTGFHSNINFSSNSEQRNNSIRNLDNIKDNLQNINNVNDVQQNIDQAQREQEANDAIEDREEDRGKVPTGSESYGQKDPCDLLSANELKQKIIDQYEMTGETKEIKSGAGFRIDFSDLEKRRTDMEKYLEDNDLAEEELRRLCKDLEYPEEFEEKYEDIYGYEETVLGIRIDEPVMCILSNESPIVFETNPTTQKTIYHGSGDEIKRYAVAMDIDKITDNKRLEDPVAFLNTNFYGVMNVFECYFKRDVGNESGSDVLGTISVVDWYPKESTAWTTQYNKRVYTREEAIAESSEKYKPGDYDEMSYREFRQREDNPAQLIK